MHDLLRAQELRSRFGHVAQKLHDIFSKLLKISQFRAWHITCLGVTRSMGSTRRAALCNET